MTACVNRKHTKKVAAVVTASLVGALSLGAAPVAAMADTGIETLTAGDVEDVVNGSITAYVDQDGDAIEGTEFTANGKAQYIVPTEVTLASGPTVNVEDEGLDVYYYSATNNGGTHDELADGTDVWYISDPSTIKTAGTYYVGVGADGVAGADKLTVLKFTIVDRTLEDATVVGADENDTVIEYTGADQKFSTGELNIYAGGKLLDYGTDYTANTKRASDDINVGQANNDIPHDAGEYVVTITGQGDYAGLTKEIRFSIAKLNLVNATVEFAQPANAIVGTALPSSISDVAKINGKSISAELAGLLSLLLLI